MFRSSFLTGLILLAMLISHSTAFSQTVPIIPGDAPLPLLVTSIQLPVGEISPPIQTNIRGRVGLGSLRNFVSDGGGIIIIDKGLILKREDRFHTYSRIDDKLPEGEWLVSNNGEWLIGVDFETDPVIALYYDTENFALLYEYIFPVQPRLTSINTDASMLFYRSAQDDVLRVLRRMDGDFSLVEVAEERGSFRFSSSGDRVFIRVGNVNIGFDYLQFDRQFDIWLKSSELVLRNIDNSAFDFRIVETANNGRTLLFVTGTGDDLRVGIIDEGPGGWSVPQFLDYTPVLGYGDKYSISEDGKVVAVQSAVTDLGNSSHSDIFVFIQSPKGEWVKHQVNPPGVLSLSGMLLTKDGTKLFWMPTSNFLSNAPFAP